MLNTTATGLVFYGKKNLFGDSTQYYSSNTTLEFYAADGRSYCGYTLTLYKVSNGNLTTNEIDASSFPTG
jgi:hypothetical protein